MYIFEEYVARSNRLSLVISYPNEAIVIIDKSGYEIIKISKTSNTCGKFKITRSKINKEDLSFEIDWQDYEAYINNNLRGLKKAIFEKNDIFIACWEMFLTQNQKYFCENHGHNFIFKTIDQSLSLSDRIKNIQCAVGSLDSCKLIYDKWLLFHKEIIENYSNWLVEIINDG